MITELGAGGLWGRGWEDWASDVDERRGTEEKMGPRIREDKGRERKTGGSQSDYTVNLIVGPAVGVGDGEVEVGESDQRAWGGEAVVGVQVLPA